MASVLRRTKSVEVDDDGVEVPEMKRHPDPQASKLARSVQYFPLFGMLFDVAATAPTPSQIDRALQMMLLIAALMLTTVASSAASVTFEELQDAAIRFNTQNTSWHWCAQVDMSDMAEPERQYCKRVLARKDVDRCDNVVEGTLSGVRDTVTNGYLLRTKLRGATIEYFGAGGCYGWGLYDMTVGPDGGSLGGIGYLVESTNMLACTVIINSIVYLSLTLSSFKDGTGKYNSAMMKHWWIAMAFPIFVSSVLLVWGIVESFQFLWILLVVKFPNLYDEVMLAEKSSNYTDTDPNAYNHTTNFALWSVYGIGLYSGVGTVCFLAWATVRKNRAFVSIRAEAEDQLKQAKAAHPSLVRLLKRAGCSDEYTLGLVDQNVTVAKLSEFKHQPILLRIVLDMSGVKSAGDQLAIISAVNSDKPNVIVLTQI